MKILVAADMEGITGVTCWDHVDPAHAEYARFREIMTDEVNAAVKGAFEGGATEVIVADGHALGTNILVEKLDPRARLNAGNGSPFAMVSGIEAGDVNGVIFVGYHARAGSADGILAHTWSSQRIANLWLNDTLLGEYGLNAAVCGHFGAPVMMITGDQTACAQAAELLGELETVIVKLANGFASGECLPPAVTQEKISETAKRSVSRLAEGKAPKPYAISLPVRVTVDFLQPEMAERAARLPGAVRLNGRTITFMCPDMVCAYLGFRAAVGLA
jgi:D-amino peptidase